MSIFSLVSVIIPCYNYGAYISETIESIRAQTYTNWEIIVVDDGSSDNTAEVVRQYTDNDTRIKYYYQQNKGLSSARNKGLSLATGSYIQLIDADDYIDKTKFEIQVNLLLGHPEVDLVYADTFLFNHASTPVEQREYRKFNLTMPPVSGSGNMLAMHMAIDNIFLVGSPLFKRGIVQNIGGFDPALFSLEDWHFWYRAVLSGCQVMYDNRRGTEFYVRTHGNNMTGNRYKMWKYKIQARKAIIDIIKDMLNKKIETKINLKILLKRHMSLLYEEQARFNLLFASLGEGLINSVQYFMHGEKKIGIWYDSAYWIKERLLGRNKITS